MSGILNSFFMFGGGGGGSLTDPAASGNLQLWLRADQIVGLSDGDQITTWPDASGNGRNCTAVNHSTSVGSTKPRWKATSGPNSTAAVNMFDTGDTKGGYFTVPQFISGYTSGHYFAIVKKTGENDNSAPPVGDFGSAGDEYFVFSGDSKIYDAFGSSARKTTVDPSPALANNWRLYEARSASGAWSNHLDGTQLFSTGTNTVAFNSNAQGGSGPKIGSTVTNNKVLKGLLAEVLFYNAVLNSTQISDVKTYLTSRYGLTLA